MRSRPIDLHRARRRAFTVWLTAMVVFAVATIAIGVPVSPEALGSGPERFRSR